MLEAVPRGIRPLVGHSPPSTGSGTWFSGLVMRRFVKTVVEVVRISCGWGLFTGRHRWIRLPPDNQLRSTRFRFVLGHQGITFVTVFRVPVVVDAPPWILLLRVSVVCETHT